MYRRGVELFLVRGVTAAFLIIGLVAFGKGAWVFGSCAMAVSVLAYAVWPRPAMPEGALRYGRIRAVVLPDWLGILLGSLMLVLPVWATSSLPVPAWVHPMAWLVWPMALVFFSFTVIGWQHDVFFLVIERDGLRIGTALRQRVIQWSEIEAVHPWRRDLPRWMRRLVPLLAATGHPLQAGSIMIARESRGLSLRVRGAAPVTISSDGFEQGARRLLAALSAQNITIAPGLSRLLPKGHKKSQPIGG